MNHYDELKRSVLAHPTHEMKGKVVKRIRRDILKENQNIAMNYMNIGIKDNKIFVIIETDYTNAVAIKAVLINHKILKTFEVLFRTNKTFPKNTTNGEIIE
jgi:hypothetical protein